MKIATWDRVREWDRRNKPRQERIVYSWPVITAILIITTAAIFAQAWIVIRDFKKMHIYDVGEFPADFILIAVGLVGLNSIATFIAFKRGGRKVA